MKGITAQALVEDLYEGQSPQASSEVISETYGEILFESMQKIFKMASFTENDIFFDLGWGLGKAAMQCYLQTPVKKVCGIEIVTELHEAASHAHDQLMQHYFDNTEAKRELTFIHGSFLECSLEAASIILLGSPCFSIPMLDKVGELIENTPSIHTVFSLRPLFTLERLRVKKIMRLECSWDSALCYVYR